MLLFCDKYPYPILLASTSIYRKQQLATLVQDFEVANPRVNESQYKNLNLSPVDLATKLAKAKAESLQKDFPLHVIIGADQVCHLENFCFSKPQTKENAIWQLSELQGKTHILSSAFSLFFRGKHYASVNQTSLTMRKLSLQEIEAYVQLDIPFDCAGSYKFEANGHRLFSQIDTNDPSSILGLPLLTLQTTLLQLAKEK